MFDLCGNEDFTIRDFVDTDYDEQYYASYSENTQLYADVPTSMEVEIDLLELELRDAIEYYISASSPSERDEFGIVCDKLNAQISSMTFDNIILKEQHATTLETQELFDNDGDIIPF